jgi:hypothetical protein
MNGSLESVNESEAGAALLPLNGPAGLRDGHESGPSLDGDG